MLSDSVENCCLVTHNNSFAYTKWFSSGEIFCYNFFIKKKNYRSLSDACRTNRKQAPPRYTVPRVYTRRARGVELQTLFT